MKIPIFLSVLFIYILIWQTIDSVEIADNAAIWTTGEQIFVTGTKIRQWLNGSGILNMTQWQVSKSGITGVAHHYRHGLLVFTDPELTSIFAMNATSSSSSLVVVYTGTSKAVGQVCVDWHSNNMYWTDGLFGWIGMQTLPTKLNSVYSLNPNFRIVADKHLDKTSGIAVHPHKFFLYWSDIGETPKIERSDLIGDNRKIIIWNGLMKPTALAVDINVDNPEQDRLYWTDQARGTIEYSDLDGEGRKILVEKENTAFYGLTIFEDHVLITVSGENKTSAYHKMTGYNPTVHLVYQHYPFNFVTVYSGNSQYTGPQQSVPCESDFFDCDHICVDMENDGGATCFCEDGFTRGLGHTSCTVDTRVLERHILYTNETNICSTSVNSLHSHVHVKMSVDCSVVQHTSRITRFAVDAKSSIIFFTNGSDIFEQEAYSETSKLLYHSNSIISDMDYNWMTKQVLWTEPDQRQILSSYTHASGRYSSEPEIAVANTKATKLAVDPHDRRLFWIQADQFLSRLFAKNLDESQASEIKTESINFNPRDLEFNRQSLRLWWYDSNSGEVVSIKPDGTEEKKLPQLLGNRQHQALTVFKKFVILSTEGDNDTMFDVGVIDDEFIAQQFSVNPDIMFDSIQDLHVVHIADQPQELEPCETDNGGCEHICLPEEVQRCACHLGYQLSSDGRTCITSTMQENFYFVTDTVSNALFQINRNTGDIHAIDIHPSNNVTSAAVIDMTSASVARVLWIDKATKSLKVKSLYGGQESNIGTDVSANSNLALDKSSGNVYITTDNKVILVSPRDITKTIISNTAVQGNPGKIAVICHEGVIVWIETGAVTRIVKASMDGTGEKSLVSVDISQPEDLAVDLETSVTDPYVYWCDSGNMAIERVKLNTLIREKIKTFTDREPIAIDILGDHVYFLTKAKRVISRINKVDGSGLVDVFDSPLVGLMSSLYLHKPAPDCTSPCGSCDNGGCSTVCLTSDEGRVCACQDGINLRQDDPMTCSNVERCPMSVSDGILEWDSCCLAVSGVSCGYSCKDGYTQKHQQVRCQADGTWDEPISNLCEVVTGSSTKQPLPIAAIAGGAGGGIALIVAVIVIVLCRRRLSNSKQRQPKPAPDQTEQVSVHSGEYDESDYSVIPGDAPVRGTCQAKGFDNHRTSANGISNGFCQSNDSNNLGISAGGTSIASSRYKGWPTSGAFEDPYLRPSGRQDNDPGLGITQISHSNYGQPSLSVAYTGPRRYNEDNGVYLNPVTNQQKNLDDGYLTFPGHFQENDGYLTTSLRRN